MIKKNVKVYPHNEYSKGAKALSEGLGVKRIKHTNTRFVGGPTKTIINWGSARLPECIKDSAVINNPNDISVVSNKKSFFNLMSKSEQAPRIPAYTNSLEEAVRWMADGKKVLSRTELRGSSGSGIYFSDDMENFNKGKMFVEYKKKKEEYRVHFAFGNRIDVQRKILRKEDEQGQPIDPKEVDWNIRSHSNGFIFARHNLKVPDDVFRQADRAYRMSGLDFGAVDVIFNQHEGKAYVLEINTAPGIEGTTVDNYVDVFKEYLEF